MVLIGKTLFVGGNFSETADGAVINLNNIAKYNIANGQWSALTHNGLDGLVLAMFAVGSDLYVGGDFTGTADGQGPAGMNNIAKYDTMANLWVPLPNAGLDGLVSSIHRVGTDLYFGGGFLATADGAITGIGNIIRYNPTAGVWRKLANRGLNGDVRAITSIGTSLYVGGTFSNTRDQPNRIYTELPFTVHPPTNGKLFHTRD